MRPIRRHDLSPRVEVLPLIDVIFLLLTFFIYSFLVMHFARVLSVELTPITGGSAATGDSISAVTFDDQGNLYLDQRQLSKDELRTALEAMVAANEDAELFIATQTPGDATTDRLPIFMEVMEMSQEIGIKYIRFVGPPGDDADDDDAAP